MLRLDVSSSLIIECVDYFLNYNRINNMNTTKRYSVEKVYYDGNPNRNLKPRLYGCSRPVVFNEDGSR